MGKKQTAVDYAVEKLEKFIPSGNQIAIEAILNNAKEMEKQQIKKAFLKNNNSISITNALENFEQYYNDIFKQD